MSASATRLMEAGHSPSARPRVAARAGLLQRKCACGKSPGAGACGECGGQEHAQQRVASGAPSAAAQQAARGDSRSHGETTDAGAPDRVAARLGHDFSRVRVHAGSDTREAVPPARAGEGPPHDLIVKGEIGGDESAPGGETPETVKEPAETVVDPAESAVELGNSSCPVTAVFSSTLAGQEKANCRVPDKKFGAATLARFVLQGVAPGAGSTTVTEQFKSLSDSHSVFSLLKPNSYTTNGNIFDDCYSLFSTKPLPADLELKVEQNHLLKGQVISKNIVTYTADRISIRSCKRQPGSCDFAAVCRR